MNVDGLAVLVTGGAGFIGSHLVEYLVDLGARVTIVDNLSTGSEENIAGVRSRVELKEVDLDRFLADSQTDFSAFDIVFHLAANAYIPPSVENPVFDYETNLKNTFFLLEKIRQTASAPRLVNISTAGVYGNPVRLPISESDPAIPISPYGVSKLAGERYVAVYSDIYGLCANSLRYFSVYGPRQRKQVVFDFLEKLEKEPSRLVVLGDGTQERDFAYVTDVVRATVLVATAAPGRGEDYNVASGGTVSIGELAEAVCRIRGGQARVEYTGKIRPGDAEKWRVDISRIEELGFKPEISREEGLRNVVEWFDTQRDQERDGTRCG